MSQENLSVIERLMETNPDMEIWWDSSPLVYEKWVQDMVKKAPAGKKELWEAELRRTYNQADPANSTIRGCTTNPPLSFTAVKSDPEMWNKWIDQQIDANRGIGTHDLYWMTYKEVVRRGAEMMLPIWEKTNGRYGYISGQLDPRLFSETEIMIQRCRRNPRHRPQRDDQSACQHAGRRSGQGADLQGHPHQRHHLLHPAADLGSGECRQARL